MYLRLARESLFTIAVRVAPAEFFEVAYEQGPYNGQRR